jgi:ribosomal protein S18 acetylase RimI-like enzyme
VFELRQFEADDANAVWALHDAALEGAGVHGGRGPWEEDLRNVLATYVEAGGEFLVAPFDGYLIGMGGLLPVSPGKCVIKRMRVRPNFQRQGLGRQILEALEARAQELGFEAVVLDTTEDQTAARRLYETSGYRETGRRETGRFVFIDFAKVLGKGS